MMNQISLNLKKRIVKVRFPDSTLNPKLAK